MIQFPRVELGESVVQMKELTIGQALEVSKVPERMQEARTTKFLGFAIGSESSARALTVQERYYLLMQYLSIQDETPLSADINFAAYMASRERAGAWMPTCSGLICSWRQLTGHDVEALELLCEDASDWIIASIGLQAMRLDWPPVYGEGEVKPSEQAEAISQRYKIVQELPASEFERLAREWRAACVAMTRFVMTGYDNKGITVLPVSGGADDAPMRFRPSAAFGEVCRELAGCFAEAGGEAGEGLPDDDEGGA